MNLAVFLPNWIGDLAMATPALRALRAHFCSARIIGICRPYVAALLDGAPWLDEIVFLDRGGLGKHRWPSVAWQLRKLRPELAVLFPNSFRTALVAWLARSRRIIGFNRYGRRLLLTDRLEPVRAANGCFKPTPIIDDYNRLAEAAGCPAPGHRLELFTTPTDEQAADGIWRQFGLAQHPEVICLNPGAAFGAAKHWDIDYFAVLARKLVDERRAGILVLCGPSERDMARSIAARASRPGVYSLA